MNVLWPVLAFVALERIAEVVYAARNARALLAAGGIESGAVQYPFIVALHAAWLAAMALTIAPSTRPNWWLLGAYAVLQPLRVWVVAALGPYWTTRIITLPGAPLIRTGPYRFLRHPNYVIVCAEIALLPLAFGAIGIALVFTLLNAALMIWRVRAEDVALAPRRPRASTEPLPRS